jgi:hypothetical protein
MDRVNIDGVNLPIEFVTDHTTVASFVSEFSGKFPNWSDDKLKEVYKFVKDEIKKAN